MLLCVFLLRRDHPVAPFRAIVDCDVIGCRVMTLPSMLQDILVGVNAQVAEKERKLRLIEVYNKIDAKSATTYRNKKFKKSDLLSSSRRLMFVCFFFFFFLV